MLLLVLLALALAVGVFLVMRWSGSPPVPVSDQTLADEQAQSVDDAPAALSFPSSALAPGTSSTTTAARAAPLSSGEGRAPLGARHSKPVSFSPSWLKPRDPEPFTPDGSTRFHEYTNRFFEVDDPAGIQVATYLGGPGTEWLVGAGFQSDGHLLVTGTTLGPVCEIAGITARVLGDDAPAPAAVTLSQDNRGRDVMPDWTHENATPFIVRLAPDVQTVVDVVRLPWQSGAITDALTDDEGSLYIAGRVGPNLGRAGLEHDITDAEDERGTPAFVAKLSPDLQKIVWIKTFADVMKGALLRHTACGNIQVEGGWVYVIDYDGAVLQVARPHRVGGRYNVRAVNPVDFSSARGTTRNSRTGREPWRQPELSLFDNKGNHTATVYHWPAHLVGIPHYRVVSDSSVRYLHYDDDGTLWVVGWSDGGNTVFERKPYDLSSPLGDDVSRGLNFSTWGAGVGSFMHIISMDTQGMNVHSKTLWCSYLHSRNRPNSATVEVVRRASDGSLLFVGASASGMIQTGHNLHDGMPGGPYVAVMQSDLSDLRLSSTVLATGAIGIRAHVSWGMASQEVGKRHKAVFLTGASAEQRAYTEARPAPSWRPVQKAYGGGYSDGWLLVLDLGPARGDPALGAGH